MRISRNILILALAVAAFVSQAQLPEPNDKDALERISPQPKDALKIQIADRLEFGLFTLTEPDAIISMPDLSGDLVDPAQLKTLVNSIGYGVGFHWTF